MMLCADAGTPWRQDISGYTPSYWGEHASSWSSNPGRQVSVSASYSTQPRDQPTGLPVWGAPPSGNNTFAFLPSNNEAYDSGYGGQSGQYRPPDSYCVGSSTTGPYGKMADPGVSALGMAYQVMSPVLAGGCGFTDPAPPRRTRLHLMTQAQPEAEIRCERCDQAHATESCPHFCKPRESHADAWQYFVGTGSSGPSSHAQQQRKCVAPQHLSRLEGRHIRMPGDGACLFHSIAFGLNALGFNEGGESVRRKIADFIAQSPDHEVAGTPLKSWVDWDSSLSPSSYAARIAEGRLWGGAIEMAACARIYSVDVAVYEEDARHGVYRLISDFVSDDQRSPVGVVFLLYSGRSHYDALQYAGVALELSPSAPSAVLSNAYSREGANHKYGGDFYERRRSASAESQQESEEAEDEYGCPLM